ncbi:MauE/DoxX family redox-associated membrane protein [Longitalea luteola]|uniref:MauE/DoxX family redox-associated membrane protein n=1 Tax=Longitalea luteola TaxID=2812563 RepID=UPI001A95B845|nr:MauE/DoxX family redox-associated membrane protein [Longitalea luteola]
MRRSTIIETVTVLYIILFLYTAISKIIDYPIFKEQLELSPILSFSAKPVAVLVPVAELIAVIGLMIPRWRLKGHFLSILLMVGFTLYITVLMMISEHLPCSCGGIIGLLSWKQHVILNCLFIGLSVAAIVLQIKQKKEFEKNWEPSYG